MMTKERRSSGVLKTGDFQGDPPGYSPGKRSHLNLARLQRESIRSAFMLELRWGLGDRFEHVQSLDSSEAYCSGLLSVIELSTLAFTDSGDLRGVAGGDVELGCLCMCGCLGDRLMPLSTYPRRGNGSPLNGSL